MSDEALEYRLRQFMLLMVMGVSCLMAGIGTIHFAFGESPTAGLYGAIMYGVAVGLMFLVFANGSNGVCRTIVEKVRGDISTPALTEWRDDLEERGAFSYQDELLADGGEE